MKQVGYVVQVELVV